MSACEQLPEPGRIRIMTISNAADLYLGELARQGRTPRTLRTYQRFLNKLADAYPNHDVEELTATHVRQFLDGFRYRKRIEKGGVYRVTGEAAKAATVKQVTGLVRQFFKWLHDEGMIPHDPAARVKLPKVHRPWENDEVVRISSEDVRLLLLSAEGWPERICVYLAVYTGARRHALAQARRSDYDPFDKTITFREKGGKTITKPVANELAALLDAAIFAGVYASDDDYLIPGLSSRRREGERDDRIVSSLIERVARRAGVRTTVHALRAAFAVSFLDTFGIEQKDALQQLLGHVDPRTTEHYTQRYERAKNMNLVRDMSWGVASPETLEASGSTEKEGFEPSLSPEAHDNWLRAHPGGDTHE